MKRLDGIIADVKAARGGANHPWIYDDSGNIASGVICGDVIPLLEALKEYELDVTDEEIEELLESPNVKGTTHIIGVQIFLMTSILILLKMLSLAVSFTILLWS